MNKTNTKNGKQTFLRGIIVCSLFLGACSLSATPTNKGLEDRPQLAPCTASDSWFSFLPPDTWPPFYHSTVNEIIEAHYENYGEGSGDPYFSKFDCKAPDLKGALKPSVELYTLASNLPPWHYEKNAGNLSSLSEADLGAVLLEFLRVYECAFREHEAFLPLRIQEEYESERVADPTMPPLSYPELNRRQGGRLRLIRDERMIARKTLDRVLTLVGGIDRLRPLSVDLECFQRASLDLRNVVGLMAETTSCMPRVWDARGSLRDPAP